MAVLIAEIVLSLFAVFGVYAAVRLLFTAIFMPAEYGVAIEITEEIDEKTAEMLLESARDGFWFPGNGRVVVLMESDLPGAMALYEFFEERNAVCYLTELREKEE